MSLSLRDELRVELGRDRVQFVRIGRKLTLRGVARSVLEKKSCACAAGEESPAWRVAMQVLESELAGMQSKPACVQVTLSNHYLRYAMIESDRGLSNAAEEIAYARHRFAQLYGPEAQSWELMLDGGEDGKRQLACAVDSPLLQALRGLCKRAGVKLASVQPCLMKAFNNCHADLQQKDVWFVQFDEGSLCIGEVRLGRWNSVRTLKAGSDWLERLPEILDREAFLTEQGTAPDEICLWSPEHWKTELPKSERWKFRRLQPVIRPGFAAEYDGRFAVALCG